MNRAELAQALFDAISGVKGITSIGGGGPVEVSTQYAGGKVPGVVLADSHVEVRLVLNELPVSTVASRVHKVAARVLKTAGDVRPVRVVVTDIEVESLSHAIGR